MLTEIKQNRAGRRWFTAAAADLYVWGGDSGPVSAFEYCYRFGGAEYSLRWDSERGFEFGGIDDGEAGPLKNRSPIRTGGGAPPWGLIARHFRRHARGLEPAIFDFILARLVEAAHSA